MTNEAIRARMWEAYKAGKGTRGIETMGLHFAKLEFDKWLAESFPELVGDGCDGEPIEERPPLYYHNFGCRAHHHTPNGRLDCTCDGSEDPTKPIELGDAYMWRGSERLCIAESNLDILNGHLTNGDIKRCKPPQNVCGTCGQPDCICTDEE